MIWSYYNAAGSKSLTVKQSQKYNIPWFWEKSLKKCHINTLNTFIFHLFYSQYLSCFYKLAQLPVLKELFPTCRYERPLLPQEFSSPLPQSFTGSRSAAPQDRGSVFRIKTGDRTNHCGKQVTHTFNLPEWAVCPGISCSLTFYISFPIVGRNHVYLYFFSRLHSWNLRKLFFFFKLKIPLILFIYLGCLEFLCLAAAQMLQT